MDLWLHDGVKLWYPTCGESVQPLQSVKFIRIAVSMVSDELQFGFNNQMGQDEWKHERVCDFRNEWVTAMCRGNKVFNNT